jgi:hypothetical protein
MPTGMIRRRRGPGVCGIKGRTPGIPASPNTHRRGRGASLLSTAGKPGLRQCGRQSPQRNKRQGPGRLCRGSWCGSARWGYLGAGPSDGRIDGGFPGRRHPKASGKVNRVAVGSKPGLLAVVGFWRVWPALRHSGSAPETLTTVFRDARMPCLAHLSNSFKWMRLIETFAPQTCYARLFW